MTQEGKVKTDIFLAATILFIFLSVVGWISAFAKSEGTIGNGLITNFLANTIFYIFPLVLLSQLFKDFNFLIVIFLLINIFLYSYLISTFCFKFFVKTKKYKPYFAIYYVSMSLLLIIFANVIGFIIENS